MGLEKD